MADQQLFVTKQCNVSQLLPVSDILPFWTQFGREGATATRNFRGITSCKLAVILYILLCEIKFHVITPDIVVHYNAMLSDMIFNKLLVNMSYAYFFHNTNPSMSDDTVLTSQEIFMNIISTCNILPVGLYDNDNGKRSMKHYFLIVKFAENYYRIISAYGG